MVTTATMSAIAEIPQDIWEKMKTETFYLTVAKGPTPQIRVTTGWWDPNWNGDDICQATNASSTMAMVLTTLRLTSMAILLLLLLMSDTSSSQVIDSRL